jgi:hypothetical protein
MWEILTTAKTAVGLEKDMCETLFVDCGSGGGGGGRQCTHYQGNTLRVVTEWRGGNCNFFHGNGSKSATHIIYIIS